MRLPGARMPMPDNEILSDTLLPMELTCNRCHQTVQTDTSFCPYCGLPQLLYTAADAPSGETGQAVRWNDAVRDASAVAWKPALRWAIPLAVPAGLMTAFLGITGLLLMSLAGAWAVSLYVRGERPPWITIGAGARIGLVFGLIAGWLAFAAGGGALFVKRYALHQGDQIDTEWKQFVDLDTQFSQRFSTWAGTADAAAAQQFRVRWEALLLSPEGHAGMIAANFAFTSLLLVAFATFGGALSARMQIRRRRPKS